MIKSNVPEDPFYLVTRIARRLKTNWFRLTYPFHRFGKGTAIEFSAEMPRSMSPEMSIGNDVYIAAHVWMTVIPGGRPDIHPRLLIGDRCSIGRRTSLSAHNSIVLEDDVLIGPAVVMMDYNHEFKDPNRPIKDQGVTIGGRITIERNSWIAQGAAILCGRGELVIGHNSVVGANAVVTRSCPPYSVLVGNPAKIVRTYDPEAGTWVRVLEKETTYSQ